MTRLTECPEKPGLVCDEDLKECTLEFEVTSRDDEVILRFGPHGHALNPHAIVTTKHPFSGELCVHERTWLSMQAKDGTSRYGKKWIFTLKEE